MRTKKGLCRKTKIKIKKGALIGIAIPGTAILICAFFFFGHQPHPLAVTATVMEQMNHPRLPVFSTDQWNREITEKSDYLLTRKHARAAERYLTSLEKKPEWKSALFIGDSITYGIRPGFTQEDPVTITYPGILTETLGIEQYSVNAYGGSTYCSLGLKGFWTRRDEFPDEADVIFVMGGINDVLNIVNCHIGDADTPDTILGDAQLLYNYLDEKYPKADIYVIIPYFITVGDIYGLTCTDQDEEDVMNGLRTLALSHNYYVIDLDNSHFMDTRDNTCVWNILKDKFHPNEEGYYMLGQMIAAEAVRLKYQSRDGMEGY